MPERDFRAELREATEDYRDALERYADDRTLVHQMVAARASLDALHEEVVRDAERLDWLEARGEVYGPRTPGEWDCIHDFSWFADHGPIRESIDAARSSTLPETTDDAE